MPFGLMLVCVNLYWGLTQVLIKHALVYMSSSTYVALRFLAAASVLAVIARMNGRRIRRSTLRDGALLGLLVGGQMLLNTYSLYFTSSTNAVFISQLSVVAVPAICCIRGRSVPSARLVVTVCMVLAGLALFTGMLDGSFNKGDFVACVAMVGSCAQIIFGSRAAARNDALCLSLVQMAVAAALSLPCAFFQGGPAPVVSFESMGIIVLTGAVGSGVCHTLMLVAQKHISPSSVSFISVLYPIFAMVGAAMIPDAQGVVEAVTAAKLAGACVMVAGMLLFIAGERKVAPAGGKRFQRAGSVRKRGSAAGRVRTAVDNAVKGRRRSDGA